jgi:hypothetical protein
MKYAELIWALDVLSKYYPKYHGNELMILAEDVVKWLNNELAEDSSSAIYLQSLFGSPVEALSVLWQELQLLARPFQFLN